MTPARILLDPARCAADPSLARMAWLAACTAAGIRVVQHRLPPVPIDHAARRARLRRDLMSLPDGDAA